MTEGMTIEREVITHFEVLFDSDDELIIYKELFGDLKKFIWKLEDYYTDLKGKLEKRIETLNGLIASRDIQIADAEKKLVEINSQLDEDRSSALDDEFYGVSLEYRKIQISDAEKRLVEINSQLDRWITERDKLIAERDTLIAEMKE